MYKDAIEETQLNFASEEAAQAMFESVEFINALKTKYGKELPYLFTFMINKELKYATPNPTKQGIPMDWVYFAELEPITPKVINAEENIEKRRLLIMEYGINNYLEDVKVINTDVYGTLISAVFSGDKQKFVKVRNGTKEPEEAQAYLKEKGMLTDDGHKIYYIPVPSTVKTAKQGIEWSWGLNKGDLPKEGWDYET